MPSLWLCRLQPPPLMRQAFALREDAHGPAGDDLHAVNKRSVL
jgi:hypothetical protein